MRTTLTLSAKGILLVAFMWTFGLHAALYDHAYGHPQRILVTFASILALYGTGRMLRTFPPLEFSAKPHQLLFAGLITGLFILANLPALLMPLNGDALYHAQQSQVHSFSLLKIVRPILTDSALSLKSAVNFINLLALGFAGTLSYYLTRSGKKTTALIFVFIALRVWGMQLGTSYDPHPPLRLLPLWLSSTLFGQNAFAYRLPQFLCLIGTFWGLQRLSSPMLGLLSWGFALCSVSIGIVWHVGSTVEQSIYVFSLFTLLMCRLMREDKLSHIEYAFACIAIACTAVMRLPAITAFALLWAFAWLEPNRMSLLKDIKWPVILSFALCVPLFVASYLKGSPATFSPDNADFLSPTAGLIERVFIAVTEGHMTKGLLQVFPLAWLVAALGVFIPDRSRTKSIIVMGFFVLLLLFYYGIKPGLWQYTKYKAEFIAPFCVLGLYLILVKAQRLAWMRGLSWIVVAALMFVNINQLMPAYQRNLLAELPFNYHDSYDYIHTNGLSDKTLFTGVTYGVMNEFLHGYNASEHKKAKHHHDTHIALSADEINDDVGVQMVIIDPNHSPKLLGELQARKWCLGPVFTGKAPGYFLVSVQRNCAT